LADSGKDTAELTRQLLMREGAYILTVNTVEAFLRGMDTMAPPELVVMAMELQGSTGLQATISLRAHPRWMRTPLY
jgi:CheY-like chemotaxis protein